MASNKKKWIIDTCYNMHETEKHNGKSKKTDTRLYFLGNIQKRQIYRDRKQITAQKRTWKGSGNVLQLATRTSLVVQ